MMMQKLMNRPFLLNADAFNALSLMEWLQTDEKNSILSISEGIATIKIHGLLTKRDEFFADTTSYESIRAAIEAAVGDDSAKAILLDIDSPGGEVGGLFDLVDYIYSVREQKPIYAYANDHAFPAAYAIASATSKIFVNRTSGVGSIGVIATHLDVSEADKKAGLKFTTIFAGEKKKDLSPHEPLTEGATEDLQHEVERLYDIFVVSVSRNRGISALKLYGTQAATYFGWDGLNIGLADEVIADPIKKIKEEFGAVPSDVVLKLKGENMAEEITAKPSEVDEYRAEILEITKLCKLAHAENRISEFVEQRMNVAQVKEALLAAQESTEEISGINYHKGTVATENPMLVAAKKIAKV